MASKYTLHYRQTDFPLIFSDIVFRPNNYGQFDYRLIQEKDENAGYLTKKGLRQAYHFGLRLLNEKFSFKIIKKLEELRKELSNKKLNEKLKKVEKKNLIKRWEILEDLIDRIGHLYRYCEYPILAPLEEIVLRACSNKDDLIRVLKNPKISENLNFNQKQKRTLCLLIRLGKLKFAIHSGFLNLFEEIYKFVRGVAKKYNLSPEQVLSMRSSEIKILLKNGKLPKIKILNERLKGTAFLPSKRKKWRLVTGKTYLSWKRKLEPHGNREIWGTVAYPGKARGRVKLHLSLIKGVRIPRGSVLVTGMTNPQIVPFLKNAAAIVTDEGGITCHAAIMSREMNKPCIIGTKIATKVLKDGQVVEVDANKGVVRVLK